MSEKRNRIAVIPGDGIGPEVVEVLKEGKVRTYDIGGSSKDSEMSEAIVAAIEKKKNNN